MEAIVVMSAATNHLDRESMELRTDRSGEIDTPGIPSCARSVGRKTTGNLVSDFKAARADAGADDGGVRLVPTRHQCLQGCSDHTVGSSTPPSVGDADGPLADEGNGQAVGHGHGYGQARIHGDESVCRLSDPGAIGLDHHSTVHLAHPGPLRRDAE
jgi:hypothetical protein